MFNFVSLHTVNGILQGKVLFYQCVLPPFQQIRDILSSPLRGFSLQAVLFWKETGLWCYVPVGALGQVEV